MKDCRLDAPDEFKKLLADAEIPDLQTKDSHTIEAYLTGKNSDALVKAGESEKLGLLLGMGGGQHHLMFVAELVHEAMTAAPPKVG
jgi:hypothetical protein